MAAREHRHPHRQHQWLLGAEADTLEGHGVDGAGNLKMLVRQHGGRLPDTLMASSPSGSIHHYFRWPKGLIVRSHTGLIPGVDVKGEGGMVLAPPSRRPGYERPYLWLNWGQRGADAPAWLLEMVAEKPRRRKHRAPAPVSPDSADFELIRAALGEIPADNYDEWVTVGCALKNVLGDSGFALFDAWSATASDNYKGTDDCERKWCRPATSLPVSD